MTIDKIREITKAAQNTKAQQKKEEIIQTKILPAAQKGERYCTINGNTDDAVITLLKAEGYQVYFYRQGKLDWYYSSDYYKIEW